MIVEQSPPRTAPTGREHQGLETPRQPGRGIARYEHTNGVNVCGVERTASLVGGLGLIGLGLSRRSLPGLLLAGVGGVLAWRGYSGRCAVYRSLGIDTAHRGGAQPSDYFERGIRVEESTIIDLPREEVYRFWRQIENLPRFMNHLESVSVIDGRRSRWRAKAPVGASVEWEAEIINEEEGRLIAWRSLPGADVDNTGSVNFRDIPGRGTEVRVTIEYLPPAGRLGSWVAWAFGEEPGVQVRNDLNRLKRLLEKGQIAGAGQETEDGRMRGGLSEAATASSRGRAGSTDPVTEASKESFPASDPPGWTGTRS